MSQCTMQNSFSSSLHNAFYYVENSSNKNSLALTEPKSGSSAQTFISSVWDFVVKWQSLDEADVEKACTDFMRKTFVWLSFSNTYLDKRASEQEKMKNLFFHNLGKNFTCKNEYPLFVSFKQGRTLLSFFRKQQQQKMDNQELLKKVFFQLGEISVYDSFVGNTDRMLRQNFSQYVSTQDKSFIKAVNSGNLLIEQTTTGLKQIHFIDSTPHFIAFFGLEETGHKESSTDDVINSAQVNLFASDSSDCDDNSISGSCNDGGSASITGRTKRESLRKEFLLLMNYTAREVEKVAEFIFGGIIKELEEEKDLPLAVSKVKEWEKPLKIALCQGILQGRVQILRNLPTIKSHLPNASSGQSENNLTTIFFHFVRKNVDGLKPPHSKVGQGSRLALCMLDQLAYKIESHN